MISVMMKNLERAKQIYFDYVCSYFFMSRDGILEEYNSFGISKKQELKWRKEFVDLWSNQLSLENFDAINKLSHASAYEAIPSILKIYGNGDSYSTLWFSIALINISRSTYIKKKTKIKLIDLIKKKLNEIINNPIIISSNNKKIIRPHVKALNAKTTQEYVFNYAKILLKELD